MSKSLSYGKQIIAKWIKEKQLDNRVKDVLLEMLGKAKIPDEWEHSLWNLAEKITALTCYDSFRSNWHSIHCECDECMELEYGTESC